MAAIQRVLYGSSGWSGLCGSFVARKARLAMTQRWGPASRDSGVARGSSPHLFLGSLGEGASRPWSDPQNPPDPSDPHTPSRRPAPSDGASRTANRPAVIADRLGSAATTTRLTSRAGRQIAEPGYPDPDWDRRGIGLGARGLHLGRARRNHMPRSNAGPGLNTIGFVVATIAAVSPFSIATSQMPTLPVLQNGFAAGGMTVAVNYGTGDGASAYALAASWGPASARFQVSGAIGGVSPEVGSSW